MSVQVKMEMEAIDHATGGIVKVIGFPTDHDRIGISCTGEDGDTIVASISILDLEYILWNLPAFGYEPLRIDRAHE